MTPATILRTARRRNGLTQKQLAERVGTSQPVISAYERGLRDPSVATLRRIVAGTGESLVVALSERTPDLPLLATPADHARALVDVLLLADAVPRRRAPERHPSFPRLDSTERRT
ncbi:MAG: helix-turn-helix transcriptional regulator [Actinobacteria bacterium]|nr:helix-turn-helix transcriptional regulator [Actinomycetota bacterium]